MQPSAGVVVEHCSPLQKSAEATLPDHFLTDLFDCYLDPNSCREVFFCFCCQVGYQHGILTTGRGGMDRACCCLSVVGCTSAACAATVIRFTVRHHFKLTDEGDCKSFLVGFYCSPCSLCQTYRELSVRGMWPGGVCVSFPFTLPGIAAPPVEMMHHTPRVRPASGTDYVAYD